MPTDLMTPYEVRPIGRVESPLLDRERAPKQGFDDDRRNPVTGVFSTRSQDRPNPVGLHRVRVVALDVLRVRVSDLEALDGTPILDIKPVLAGGR